MKTKTIYIILFLLSGPVLCAQSTEPDSIANPKGLANTGFDLSFNIDWTTNYIWRDFQFGYSAYQPSINVDLPGIPVSINHWLSFGQHRGDSIRSNSLSTLSGLDLQNTSTLTINTGKTINIGLIYYSQTLPDSLKAGGAGELFISLKTGYPFNPSITVYIGNNKEIYSLLSFSESRSINDWTINFGGSIAYRPYHILYDKGLRDFNLELSAQTGLGNAQAGFFFRVTRILGELRNFRDRRLSTADRTELQAGIRISLN